MKRHRIFSYILMFLIIGMCVRNLHYVYALDEEALSLWRMQKRQETALRA